MTTGAEVGSLISATHDVPDSVSNENGPDFSNLKGIWTGFEIAHLFFCLCLFLLQKRTVQIDTKTKTKKAEAHDRMRTKGLGLCLFV